MGLWAQKKGGAPHGKHSLRIIELVIKYQTYIDITDKSLAECEAVGTEKLVILRLGETPFAILFMNETATLSRTILKIYLLLACWWSTSTNPKILNHIKLRMSNTKAKVQKKICKSQKKLHKYSRFLQYAPLLGIQIVGTVAQMFHKTKGIPPVCEQHKAFFGFDALRSVAAKVC